MVSMKHYYHSIQRQSRCKDHAYVLDTLNAAGMDETYGTYVDDGCFDMMMILTMMLRMILMMMIMMILMMVGAGTCILSEFPAAVPGSLVVGP